MIIKAFSNEYFNQLKLLRKKKILFFNGCFDILHVGHLTLINEIKKSKEINHYTLVCGLNSDESVKKQNKSHPLINDEKSRAKALELLGIDYVIIFDEDTPTSLLMSIIPDTVIKGSDYIKEDYAEKKFLVNSNILIKYVDIQYGYSTSKIYNKIAEYVKTQIRESI